MKKEKKMNNNLLERSTAENFAITSYTNINSTLGLFSDHLYPNKKRKGIIKSNFRRFVNEYKVWCFSKGDNIVIKNNDITLNTTRNKEDVSCSSLLTSSNNSEEKDSP